jgi:hypothetical protein
MNTTPLFSANFVGIVVGFLNVLKYTPAEPPPCRLVVHKNRGCMIAYPCRSFNEILPFFTLGVFP